LTPYEQVTLYVHVQCQIFHENGLQIQETLQATTRHQYASPTRRGNAIPAGPLINFYKIRRGEGVPGSYLHAKLQGCGFKNVGLHAQKSPKLVPVIFV